MKKAIILMAAIMINIATLSADNTTWSNSPNHQAPQQYKKMTNEERMDMHTLFVVKMLKLDDATATKFMPLFKEYMKENKNIRISGSTWKLENKENLTEEEAEKIIKERLEISRKLLNVREKYYAKFSKIITAIQIKKIYDMEQLMDAKMRNMANIKRPNNGNRPGEKHKNMPPKAPNGPKK